VSAESTPRARTIRRLVGVYDANGTVRGELAYFLGARFGRAHCALCDITHGRVRPKPEWEAYRARLQLPFDTYHRDDQPEALRNINRPPPIVAAETDTGFVVLLGPDELEACDGALDAFVEALTRALARASLTRPT
jgi:hypothetical protein